MKKIILMTMMFMVGMIVNAQVAYEKSKMFDNTYISTSIGATTPLTFNSVFPVNPAVSLKFGKNLTPVFGLQLDGMARFGDNGIQKSKTFVKNTNLGLNGVINWSNMLCGYNPGRLFGIKTVTGIGWLHYYGPYGNDLSAKTALDFDFNLGHGNTICIEPSIVWNLSKTGSVQFNKNYAQLGIFVGYIYNFRTSNGTHGFKEYNIGEMNEEINTLKSELASSKSKVVEKVVKEVSISEGKWFIFFAKNSSTLTEEAKDVLNLVPSKSTVDIVASSSPEGRYNQEISEKRAAIVSDYLTKKGIIVNSSKGVGSTSDTSGRIAVISLK